MTKTEPIKGELKYFESFHVSIFNHFMVLSLQRFLSLTFLLTLSTMADIPLFTNESKGSSFVDLDDIQVGQFSCYYIFGRNMGPHRALFSYLL